MVSNYFEYILNNECILMFNGLYGCTLHGMRIISGEERIAVIPGLSFSQFVLVSCPALRLAGAEEDVDQPTRYVDDAGDSEDLVPLGHLTGARHAGHDDGG